MQYEYDALGRRTKKIFNNKIIRYLWDGNVLLHEWEYSREDEPKRIVNNLGEISYDKKEPINNLVTWVYEEGSFVPCAKIIDNEAYSIISDYVGRPVLAFDSKGEQVWSTEYDIYGGLKKLKGDRNFIPFRQLGQYEDIEVGLYYNRFRYYDCNTGLYISKDPIGLAGGFALYGYVKDSNTQVDIFGLLAFISKILTEGSVFRGIKKGQAPFYPSVEDINYYKTTGNMAGLSTKPKLDSQAKKFFQKIGTTDVLEIDISKLENLEVIQDGKAHASIRPSKNYLEKNNLNMIEALEDWNKKGNKHPLSIEMSNAINNCT